MLINFLENASCTEVTPPVTIIYISKLAKLTLMACLFFFLQAFEFGLTFFPVLHGKGLELPSQRRYQSRYLSKSISMLLFNLPGQRVRAREINRTETWVWEEERWRIRRDGRGVMRDRRVNSILKKGCVWLIEGWKYESRYEEKTETVCRRKDAYILHLKGDVSSSWQSYRATLSGHQHRSKRGML